jgi:anti-anti-sigma factor
MSQEMVELSTEPGELLLLRLRLPDQIDPMEFDRLNDRVTALIGERAHERWIVDLSVVTYMGSAVLGLMVNIRQQVKSAGGSLVLCCMSEPLHKIFAACCLERLFVIKPTRAEAIHHLK